MASSFFRLVLFLLVPLGTAAQQLQFSQPHGFCDQPFTLQIAHAEGQPLPEGAVIRYTLDGSEPTAQSTPYTQPLDIAATTILRAAAISGTERVTPVATATYLFADDVLQQGNAPEGYPDTWGSYTQISGTAKADYEMDPEMTADPLLRPRIKEGLTSLPVLSIVTDKDNLFSHENDPDRGGIYIFTGPPVGDDTGHGWTRPASIELFESNAASSSHFNLTTACGLRLHGGHGRLAEKNPKHSFRLVFKKEYGPSALNYPLFGDGEPAQFKQLVLRCHFGNSWQHWAEGNRTKAQYTRDVWARRMQRKMGRTSVNALYVNLFINGMYWGLYNMAERVDDQYGKDHLGGKKSDIDVLKIEEDGGNHIEASEGDLNAWEEMLAAVSVVGGSASDNNSDESPDAAYARLATLLDIDAFIDYMLINQYAGNTDWDHHNWYAIRRRGADSEGFRFLCWDSEIIFENPKENVLTKNNGDGFPTGIFNQLISYPPFARRYLARAKELLAADGLLGEQSVVAVWDSLYHTIETAVYAEAARWGDYRRDVHRWQTGGQLYTVDEHYMAERNRLLTQYFPVRTGQVLSSILSFVDVDDFEAPDGWTPLTASMFHEWSGSGADAQPLDVPVNVSWQMNTDVGGGGAIAGFVGVEENRYADLSSYDGLVLRGTGSGLRILANRLVPHGPWKQIVVSFNDSDPYWDSSLQAIVVPLDDLRTKADTDGKPRVDTFVHLNALKVDWNSTVRLLSAHLTPKADIAALNDITLTTSPTRCFNLSGQQVKQPFRSPDGGLTGRKGIYIIGGRKVIVR